MANLHNRDKVKEQSQNGDPWNQANTFDWIDTFALLDELKKYDGATQNSETRLEDGKLVTTDFNGNKIVTSIPGLDELAETVRGLLYTSTYYEWRSAEKTENGFTYDYYISLRSGISSFWVVNVFPTTARNKGTATIPVANALPPASFQNLSYANFELFNNSGNKNSGLGGIVRPLYTINGKKYGFALDNYFQGNSTDGYTAGANLTAQPKDTKINEGTGINRNNTKNGDFDYAALEKDATFIQRDPFVAKLAKKFGIPAENKLDQNTKSLEIELDTERLNDES